ncbi:tRNA (adenosine(37)-N6)-threonylcarbamoyltransferase complex dimerization subunit type 1 TsaB [Deinococcus sp.]|uniref:tRNA (adenosine(37)-N6)-threonylcarbamoyltransferase complex dimerization subunit type 1 TsaB n=1 Tax=Deinococcus sp. TaxID=47478 RepID=UPI003B5C2525
MTGTPLTLAIETATPYLALGLLGSAGSWHETRQVGRAHAEQLPEALGALLAASGVSKHDIASIIIGTGPGSYTGVRVGASFALGLGRAWGVSVRGVPTLEALIDAQHEGLQAVTLDARKEQLYGAVYRVASGAVAEIVTAPGKFAQTDFAAHLTEFPGILQRPDAVPDALALARAGQAHGAADWTLAYL